MRTFTGYHAFLIVIYTLSSFSVKAQPVANFSATITSGCSPLIVQFADLSTGSPTTWFWDFGNGTTSTLQNPGVIYINPGTYTIKLMVTNANGTDSLSRIDYIQVAAKPLVNFTAQNKKGCAPLKVSFQDLSDAGINGIQAWEWDFGDGNISKEQNPTHTYSSADTFSVTLTVTNIYGCRQTFQQKNFVDVLFTPKSSFDYQYDNVCLPPALVNFTNTSRGEAPTRWQWTFGDGANSTAFSPSHSYLTSGNFLVTLTAVSKDGCSDTAKSNIRIGTATAFFTNTKNSCVNEWINFSDSSTPVAINGYWDFGDGTQDTGLNVRHKFQNEGTYQVTYTAVFGSCSAVFRKNIKVTNRPDADFSVTGNNASCNPPLTVSFENQTSGATNYIWDFGDGTGGGGLNTTHTYTSVGNYSVTLIATNSNGCSDTITKNSIVKLGPPVITELIGLPAAGCKPVTVNFAASFISPEPITSWQWSFGDGNTSTQRNPVHTYTEAGNYNVRLIITTSSGCADTMFMADAVLVGDRPTARFSATPRSGCANSDIIFSDTSRGNITEWFWDFGDGTTSTSQSPTHIYTDTGYFTVQLIVSSNGCTDTLVKANYIYTLPPVARFKVNTPCSNKYNRTFTDLSIAPETWFWDFGDGTTSTEASPSHLYADTGSYNVTLKVTNGDCEYATSNVVNIVDENPGFEYRPQKSNYCKYDSVIFEVTNYNPANIAAFNWDFGDGVSSGFNSLFDTVLHMYTAAGIYYPQLLTKDINGCIDTLDKGISLTIYGPLAGFSSPPGNCVNKLITFSDESLSDGIHPISNWFWDYGDGTTNSYTSPPFEHRYTATGSYDILMKVFDSNGCMDSMLNRRGVVITSPKANFSAENLFSCTDYRVQFIDSTLAESPIYLWQFGDGQQSSSPEPKHFYEQEGVYTIKLTITDNYGCIDSLEKIGYITISDPVANFSVADSVLSCPPATMSFQNLSLNSTAFQWDFGTGNTSDEKDPTQVYTLPGIYEVQLISTGFGTCYDTTYKKVELKGPSAVFSFDPLEGCSPHNVTFTAEAKNTTSFIWDFGNGVTQVTTQSQVIHRFNQTGLYTPRLVIEDSAGCQVPVPTSDTVKVIGADASFSTLATSICDESSVQFIQTSVAYEDTIQSYKWFFGDGDSSLLPNPTHSYKQAGPQNLQLIIQTTSGCQVILDTTLNIHFEVSPKIRLNSTDSACQGLPVFLNATDSNDNNITWLWDMGNGDTVRQQSLTYLYSQPGTFQIKVSATTAAGCSDTASSQIIILPEPLLTLTPDTSICRGGSTSLYVSGATEYVWKNTNSLSCLDCANPIASPLVNETYYLTGTNENGCSSSAAVNIYVVQPQKLIPPPPDTLCLGSTVMAKASGTDIYSWQPSAGVSDPSAASPMFSPLETTNYLLVGTDKLGCFRDSANFQLTVYPIPQVSIAEKTVAVNAGETYVPSIANSPDVTSWNWQPPLGLSCTNCKQPVIQPKAPMTYTLTVSNEGGCESSASIIVDVLCKNENVFIPNTFSPNRDGTNDVFYPRGKGLFNIKGFRIFNRWGQVVFEKSNISPNDPGVGWDGTYKGQAVMPDVYVFVLDVVCDNGLLISRKGNVTLIR
jgi:gliding motility-associated-like protein